MNRSRVQTALPSSKKTHSEKHKQILKQLLKENGNRTCVDCKTTAHPRWASWNLGCFICIRCSGIHRSMGTHISKVKSVDLDAWTDEQVESMVKWGNEKCNSYWEAKLPDGYIPDQLKIENFIRTKYDMKKWVGSSNIPDPMKIPSSKKANDLMETTSTNSVQSTPAPTTSNLLDDDFGTFTSASSSTPSISKPVKSVSTPPAPIPAAKESPKSLPKLPIQTSFSPQTTGNGRPDLKKSILSLYSSPSSSNSSFIQPKAPTPIQVQSVSNPPSNSYDPSASLSNSLQGLNFGSNPTPAPVPINNTLNSSHSTINSTNSTNSNQKAWNNEWSDINNNNTWNNNTSVNNTVNNNSLDDDLFKNVWK